MLHLKKNLVSRYSKVCDGLFLMSCTWFVTSKHPWRSQILTQAIRNVTQLYLKIKIYSMTQNCQKCAAVPYLMLWVWVFLILETEEKALTSLRLISATTHHNVTQLKSKSSSACTQNLLRLHQLLYLLFPLAVTHCQSSHVWAIHKKYNKKSSQESRHCKKKNFSQYILWWRSLCSLTAASLSAHDDELLRHNLRTGQQSYREISSWIQIQSIGLKDFLWLR